jgi:hypothetical protein
MPGPGWLEPHHTTPEYVQLRCIFRFNGRIEPGVDLVNIHVGNFPYYFGILFTVETGRFNKKIGDSGGLIFAPEPETALYWFFLRTFHSPC